MSQLCSFEVVVVVDVFVLLLTWLFVVVIDMHYQNHDITVSLCG